MNTYIVRAKLRYPKTEQDKKRTFRMDIKAVSEKQARFYFFSNEAHRKYVIIELIPHPPVWGNDTEVGDKNHSYYGERKYKNGFL